MQLGRTKLTPEERQRRLREGRCFYSGERGHSIANCRLLKDLARQHPVLVDSGLDASFIDFELAKKLNLETFPLPRPMEASALDGRLPEVGTRVT
ncbi:hypothetical protein OYC64_000235 [Pagothenia borchgrevinki]|uniref:Uncharacterized protein n=1 Tax=Pagothenia borchgrevinki TaxID=8213 RepID=A0ABD2HFN0_PAGBO